MMKLTKTKQRLSIILLLLIALSIHVTSQTKQPDIGYLVVVSTGKHHSVHKVIDFTVAQNIVSNHFVKEVDLNNLMRGSNYVNIDTEGLRVYVERKIFIDNNGKIRTKRIKDKHKVKIKE